MVAAGDLVTVSWDAGRRREQPSAYDGARGVADFARDLFRDRTRLGLAVARRRGVRFGRRPKPGPAPATVVGSRAAGKS